MKFVFTLNKTCTDSGKCSDIMFAKLKTLLETNDQQTFHLSISHVSKKHHVWVFLYSKAGEHESESQGKNRVRKNNKIKKFIGKIPTLTQLKANLI